MAQRVERLPYGVGRFTARWVAVAALAAAVLGVGVYAYFRQYTQGEIVTGLRDIGTMGGATWGLYVGFVVYFVGVSFAGIILATLIRLLNLHHLKPVARMAELLAVISLLLAAFTILADVGNPVRAIINLPKYARPGSPFFGTFTVVIAGYLFASLVYLYLDTRRDAGLLARTPGRLQGLYRAWAAGYGDRPAERERHHRTTFWLAVAIVPLLVTAHSTLGFVFGLQIGRPGWHSALQAPGFVILAGVSGAGLLLLLAGITRRVVGERERLSPGVFRWLNNFLMVSIFSYLYFWVVEVLSTIYQGDEHEVRVAKALFHGTYAWLYWLSLGLLLVPLALLIWQYFQPRHAIAIGVASGVLVNLAAIGKRYVLVVPSQTHGTLLPYGTGAYAPTWVEYMVIVGLFALGTLLFAAFMKVFPIIEMPEAEEGAR